MVIQGIERLVQSTSFTTESSLPGRAQASPKLRQAAETFQYAIPLLDNIKDIPFTELSPEQRAVAREGRKLGLDYLAEGIKQFGSPKAAALVKSLNDLAEPLQVALDGIFHEIQIRRVNGKVEENKLTPLAIAKEVLENSGVRKEVSQIPGVDQLIQSIDSNVRGQGENISLLSSLAQVYTKPDPGENLTFEFSKSRKYAESLVGASTNQGIRQPEEITDKAHTEAISNQQEKELDSKRDTLLDKIEKLKDSDFKIITSQSFAKSTNPFLERISNAFTEAAFEGSNVKELEKAGVELLKGIFQKGIRDINEYAGKLKTPAVKEQITNPVSSDQPNNQEKS